MEKEKKYNIGLDIGVASIGWCVTDDENNVLKKGNKHMWGSRIFNEASTATNRRNFRSTRRRINRRKERIKILQSLMLDDMEKEYPNFFPMIKESSNVEEDKKNSELIYGKKYNLFSENNFTDKDFYSKFPTIYHLRYYLVNSTEKVDIRLVYLAIHNIIKYRGNFLHETNFSENSTEIDENLDDINMFLSERYIYLKNNNIKEILTDEKTSKAEKREKLMESYDYDKEDKQFLKNIINAILGYSFDISKIFEVETEKTSLTFTTEIENEDEIKEVLGDYARIYEILKTIYSWYVLQNILKGKKYISEAFIDKYEKYNKDLKLLKKLYKKYFKDEYAEMFRKEGKNNYVAYNGKNCGKSCKKCKPEEFFKALKNKIEKLPEEEKDKKKILDKIADGTFLSKLNVTDNGAIPYQLHQLELERILENQSAYYKTIKDNKDKILQLLYFRIPYFVGPLAKNKGNKECSKWSWIVRKNDEKIYPWNFESVVDIDETAEKFIRRMTNKCTYLINEDVMPKQSLLYSKFCVLNELNNIRINEKSIPKDTKRLIIDKLFKEKKKVTKKMVINLLEKEGIKIESFTGLSDGENFNSNMSTYIDLKRILGKIDEDNYEECENIIYWVTIFQEKKILERKLENNYKDLTDNQLKQILKLKYSGWSRLSKMLLVGLKSNDGENIMEKLEKTKFNFMQIINNKDFGFSKKIQDLLPKKDEKITYSDVDIIPTSPANKRAIWQAMCVVKEIVKVMKEEPNNIYIEFARSEEKNKTLKDTRAKKLLKIYDEIEKQIKYIKNYDHNVYLELKKYQSDKELTDKLYLYFIQNGKSLYSGKPLNIDELDKCEIDHIIPRSYKMIDSFDNKALVLRSENQYKKHMLVREAFYISDERIAWWKSLLKAGLITQVKLSRLTRTKMFETDNDTEKFIERQLVETRQITKYVTNLLVNEYKDSNVYSIRADLTHLFRLKYKIYKNRNINNYHHAHDAYILSVIGNILDKNWHGLGQFKYNDYIKNYMKSDLSKDEKYGIILGMINKNVVIDKVKKVLNYKDCYISRMLEEGTGEFYNQTVYKTIEKPVIPLKKDKPVEKYGGYSGENKAYFVIFEYENSKGKKEYQLIGIPIQIAYMIKNKKITEEDYIKSTFLKDKEFTKFKILKNKVLKNQEYIDENGIEMRFCSDTEVRTAKELIVNENMQRLIWLMNSNIKNLTDEEIKELEDNYEYMYEYLIEKMKKEYSVFVNIYNKLVMKNFYDLSEEKKKTVINGLIDLMETGQGNLKEIGLTDREGRMRKGKTYFNTNKLTNMIFVDKSVTGMYERRYKINGMENSSNK